MEMNGISLPRGQSDQTSILINLYVGSYSSFGWL
jgi:hypothetical protein